MTADTGWIDDAVAAGVITAEEGDVIRHSDPLTFALARELLQTKAIAGLAVLNRSRDDGT